jgi:hypothetical protein
MTATAQLMTDPGTGSPAHATIDSWRANRAQIGKVRPRPHTSLNNRSVQKTNLDDGNRQRSSDCESIDRLVSELEREVPRVLGHLETSGFPKVEMVTVAEKRSRFGQKKVLRRTQEPGWRVHSYEHESGQDTQRASVYLLADGMFLVDFTSSGYASYTNTKHRLSAEELGEKHGNWLQAVSNSVQSLEAVVN